MKKNARLPHHQGDAIMNRWNRKVYFAVVFLLLAALCASAAGCSKEAKMQRHWTKAEKYYSQEKFKEAAIEYANVVKLDPAHAQGYYKLGLCRLRIGMPREAFAAIAKAVELDPGLIDARHHLGTLYLLAGDPQKAAEQARAILAADPADARGHMLLSNMHLREKNIDAAIEEGLKAAQGANQHDAYLMLANLYMIKRDLSSAENMLDRKSVV